MTGWKPYALIALWMVAWYAGSLGMHYMTEYAQWAVIVRDADQNRIEYNRKTKGCDMRNCKCEDKSLDEDIKFYESRLEHLRRRRDALRPPPP